MSTITPKTCAAGRLRARGFQYCKTTRDHSLHFALARSPHLAICRRFYLVAVDFQWFGSGTDVAEDFRF